MLMFYVLLDFRLGKRVETRDTPCRNIMIYGKCRFENQGCAFKHDQGSRDQSPELYVLPMEIDSNYRELV